MLAQEQLPFPRGKFWALTAPDGDLWEGREFWHEDRDFGTAGAPYRSRRQVKVRVVRNTMASAIPPSQAVVYGSDLSQNGPGTTSVAGGAGTTEVKELANKGYTATVTPSRVGGISDEFLPATGVPAGALFYIVVAGPTIAKTGLTQLTSDVVVGDALVAMTAVASAATSTGTTAGGKVNKIDLAATTRSVGADLHILGRALSACTSQGYNVSLLVDVIPKW